MGETLKFDDGRVCIINGGALLPGAPKSWEWAENWESAANKGGEASKYNEPQWRFDCGFKLDYDGPMISVSSRFYPPAEHYGPKWDGNVHIFILGKEVQCKEFECDTIDILRQEVEGFIRSVAERIGKLFGKDCGGKEVDVEE